MTTTEAQTWRDPMPAVLDQLCVHSVWIGEVYAGQCPARAKWVVDYSYFDPSLGLRPHCERHKAKVLSRWINLFGEAK